MVSVSIFNAEEETSLKALRTVFYKKSASFIYYIEHTVILVHWLEIDTTAQIVL